MSHRTLDLETLRALTMAIDRGGQGQAASELGRTPSAISLQMKRLQQDIGAPLFRKDGRGLSLTEAGEIAVSYARRMLALNDELLNRVRGASLTGSVRLGCSQDFAETVLPKLPVNRELPRAKSFTWSTLFDRDLSAKKAQAKAAG